MTDAEEKQVYQEWQDKKEDNSTSKMKMKRYKLLLIGLSFLLLIVG